MTIPSAQPQTLTQKKLAAQPCTWHTGPGTYLLLNDALRKGKTVISCTVTGGSVAVNRRHQQYQRTVYACGHDIYLLPDDERADWELMRNVVTKDDAPFITVSQRGPVDANRQVTKEVYDGHGWRAKRKQITTTDSYDDPTAPNYNRHASRWSGNAQGARQVPYLYCTTIYTAPDGSTFEREEKYKIPRSGVVTVLWDGTVKTEVDFHGYKHTWSETLGMKTLHYHLKNSTCPQGYARWWQVWFSTHPQQFDDKGLKAVYKQKSKQAFWEALKGDALAYNLFITLTDGATQDKTSNNKLLKAAIEHHGWTAEGAAKFVKELHGLMAAPEPAGWHYNNGNAIAGRAYCLRLKGAGEAVRAAEAKQDHRKAKTAGNAADTLGITDAQYPKLRAAIEAGQIPTSVFNNPGGQPVNREFPLWEQALSQKGWADTVYEIAQSASTRSTYEKDITPYLNFCLNKLPAYLQRCTPKGKKWKCLPKFVKSQWELEMDEAVEGTVKRRSAFTPTVDNEGRVVTVPYVAVCVSGVRTQWCYAQQYHVFEKGMTDPISGGIVLNDYEGALNGRDDYGLMYYTLTGTVTARGYPTFLIIFERLVSTGKTRVHFHRCHPKRKDKGQYRPACQLVEATYQYMAGNIPAGEIEAQQGDMIYIKMDHDPIAAKAKVGTPTKGVGMAFESHNHICKAQSNGAAVNVELYPSEAKTPKNRLGFLKVPAGGIKVAHPEHDDIDHLSEGWYDVRRCRSWEANPRAIWSLTID